MLGVVITLNISCLSLVAEVKLFHLSGFSITTPCILSSLGILKALLLSSFFFTRNNHELHAWVDGFYW